MRSFRLKPAWWLAILLWLGLGTAGYGWLLRYSFAPGRTSVAPRTIPAVLRSSAPLPRPLLLLALHPRCPCSRATVSELAKILTVARDACEVIVLMYKPAGEPDDWIKGELLHSCRRMNCQIRTDPDGQLAASLGSLTSGGVVLYDAEGHLRYQGGITASRGHEGDNAGAQAIVQILQGRPAARKTMPVFGCPLNQEPTTP